MRTLLLLTLFAMLLGGGIWLWSGNTVEPAPAATSGDEARTAGAPAAAVNGATAQATATTDASSTPDPTREAANEAPPTDREVRGTVRRLDTPHGGAYVRVHDRAPEEHPDATLLAEAQTDANGRFAIEWDPAWPPRVAVTASAEQCVDAAQADVDGAHAVWLQLGVAISIRGAVTAHADRRPLEGVAVRHRDATVRTDAAGRYALAMTMRHREEYLSTSFEGFEPDSRRVMLHEDTELVIDFALHQQRHVEVALFDVATGAPIAGAYAAVGRGLPTDDVARTDASGALRVPFRKGSALYTYLLADGYCATRWTWPEPTVTRQPIRLPLRRAAKVTGTVRDEEGAPVAASVHVSPVEHRERSVPLAADDPLAKAFPGEVRFESPRDYVECADDGTFTLCGVPGERDLIVSASAEGHVTTTSAPFSFGDPVRPTKIDLTLRKAHQLRGVARENDAGWRGRIAWRVAGAETWSGFARTDAAGRFTLDGLPTGSIELVAMSTWGRDEMASKVVRAPIPDDAEVELAWSRRFEAISGRVTSGGAAAVGFAVRAWPSRPGPSSTAAQTAADGTYELEVPAGDTYRVTVSRGQLNETRPDVAPGARGVDFALPATATLRLRLVDAATGAPCVGGHDWSQAVWRPSGADAYRHINTRGAGIDSTGLMVVEVPSGLVDVMFHLADQGYAPTERRDLAAIAGQEPTEHRIELRRGHELRLRLDESTPMELERRRAHLFFLLRDDEADHVRGPFEAAGPPSNHRINGHHMWLARPSLTNQLVSFHADARPRKGLAPGTYTLRAFPDDVVFEPATITVPGDDEVVLRWRPR